MQDKLIRAYKKLDVSEIKKHLMIYGDLSGTCENCQNFDVKLEMTQCPKCGTTFQYIAFRNVRSHVPKIQKLMEQRPQILIIDYDDYKRNVSALKAQEFLK